MKQFLTLLAVAAAAAAITYLVAVNRQTEERANRLAQQVAEAEERVAQLEEDLRLAQQKPRRQVESQTALQVQTTIQQARVAKTEATSIVIAPSSVSSPVLAAPESPPALQPVPVPVVPWGADWVHYTAEPGGSTCKVEGTTKEGDWKLESPVIGGWFLADPRLDFSRAASRQQFGGTNLPCAASAFIPVRSLKGYNNGMDQAVMAAMEEPRFKRIEYRLVTLTLSTGSPPASTSVALDSCGELVIHGVTNILRMPVALTTSGGGLLEFSGATRLRMMTDFGIRPPMVPIAGTTEISAGDEVKVTFRWRVRRQSSGNGR